MIIQFFCISSLKSLKTTRETIKKDTTRPSPSPALLLVLSLFTQLWPLSDCSVFAGQEQGLEGPSSQCAEHWRSVRGAAVRPRPRHHGGHPGVLLEQQEECDERQTEPLLRDGGGTEVRHEVPRQQAEAGSETELLPVFPGRNLCSLRHRLSAPSSQQWRQGSGEICGVWI